MSPSIVGIFGMSMEEIKKYDIFMYSVIKKADYEGQNKEILRDHFDIKFMNI